MVSSAVYYTRLGKKKISNKILYKRIPGSQRILNILLTSPDLQSVFREILAIYTGSS